jgi:hypothetical protein
VPEYVDQAVNKLNEFFSTYLLESTNQ